MTDPAIMAQAVEALHDGQLVIIPTDTVYGVAAHPDRPAACRRLAAAKGREADKPVALLADDVTSVVQRSGGLTAQELCLARAFWPGPLTLVVDMPAGGTEGFRVPDMELTRTLLRACGGVLRVSSANLSGDPAALTAVDAAATLGAHVALVIDEGPVTGGRASSVVRIRDGQVVLLREAALARADIDRALEDLVAP
jgi:L-threonylcarbamoyladenylate synthase